MAYNSWKLMEKLDVAVRRVEGSGGRYDFTGFIVEHGDKKALEKAIDWATIENYDYKNRKYNAPTEPKIYTFDNEGFSATILDSAGGSSQGGRLSFWRCEVEKDGTKFTIGVNDAILADLIKNSDISNGKIKQKLLFARKGGQPGLIHENMEAYAEAVADMKQKSDLKSAKKTNKWEIGGVYSTLTQDDVCLGQVYDTMEEYAVKEPYNSSWRYGSSREVTKFRKTSKPQEVTAWLRLYKSNSPRPKTFEKVVKNELGSDYIYFQTGKPPARAKSYQYTVKKSDLKLIDELLKSRKEWVDYNEPEIRGRYVREI